MVVTSSSNLRMVLPELNSPENWNENHKTKCSTKMWCRLLDYQLKNNWRQHVCLNTQVKLKYSLLSYKHNNHTLILDLSSGSNWFHEMKQWLLTRPELELLFPLWQNIHLLVRVIYKMLKRYTVLYKESHLWNVKCAESAVFSILHPFHQEQLAR